MREREKGVEWRFYRIDSGFSTFTVTTYNGVVRKHGSMVTMASHFDGDRIETVRKYCEANGWKITEIDWF